MLKLKFFAKLKIVLVLIFIAHPVGAQLITRGEVININHEHQVGFVDLSSAQISQGDVLEVYSGNNFITYVEILQVQEALSKFGFVQRKGLVTDPDRFLQIAIGYAVVKVPQGSAHENLEALLSKLHQSESAKKSLQDQLQQQKATIGTAEEQKKQYLSKIQVLNNTVRSLQEKLSRITKILDEKIRIYESR